MVVLLLAPLGGTGLEITSYTLRHIQCTGVREQMQSSCSRCATLKASRQVGKAISAWAATEDLLEFYSLKLEGCEADAIAFATGDALERDFRLAGFQHVGKLLIADIYGYDVGELRTFLLERFNRKDLWGPPTLRYYNLYVKALLGPAQSTPKDILLYYVISDMHNLKY